MDNRNLQDAGKPKPLLVYLVAVYAASLLIANILASQMLSVAGLSVSAGILTFPITYILASVLAEVYGYNWARRAAWLSLGLNALMAGLIQLSIVLPKADWYNGTYFEIAVGGTWRIVVASLVAFTIGKFANDKLFSRLKGKRTNLEGFKFRAMASSIVGHVLDTTVFYLVAFALDMPWGELPGAIFIVVLLKWGYEWLVLPLTVLLVKKVKKHEGEDVSV